jgi:hypothetical protein
MASSNEKFLDEINALMDHFAARKLSCSTACAVMGAVITSAMLYLDPKAASSFVRHWTRDLKKNCSRLKETM